jgi:uncharacterized protein YigE (DUF2233 family)
MRAAFLLILLLCGCSKAAQEAPPAPVSACHEQQFESARFTVCDPGRGSLVLFAAGPTDRPLRSFAEIARQIDPRHVEFAMNAGMFDENGRPIGLAAPTYGSGHPINLRDGPGNFHLKPNGVFMVLASGRPAIFQSDRIPQFRAAPRLATQSGPMLVINGKLHPAFDADRTSRLVRNGVGVTADGRALFALSGEPVSFGKFARFFRDELKTPNALYFDGVVSSLWDPANGRQDAHSPLGPIIVALKPAVSKPDP